MRVPSVYLAGPISGCNSEQRHGWRDELKHMFSDEFDFIDPTHNLIAAERSDFEVVQADAEAIRSADAVLANMWRESIGTSIGILHGHLAGKIVCVCDPNRIGSRMAAFYADAVERTLPGTLSAIRTFLQAQSLVAGVRKQSGEIESFDREKLSIAVRKTCLAAGTGDIVATRAIVAKTLELLLLGSPEERIVASAEIRETVWEALAQLAADPANEVDYDRVRRAWNEFADDAGTGAKSSDQPQLALPVVHEAPLKVTLRTQGTHSTIWGHLNQINPSARAIFDEMRRVDGIVEIVFGPFRNTGAPPSKPHVRVQASKTAHIIDGTCFDKGRKGTLQTFQVHVGNPAARDTILQALRDHLVRYGAIRSGSLGLESNLS